MANSLPWVPATAPPTLADNELHVWRASLDLSSDVRERLQSTLNSDEKTRVERLLIEKAREHFVAARGILRELLGAYLGVDGGKIAFRYGPEGKPSLSPEHNSKISFNVSHSNGMGLFVFANDQEIGADIEYVKTDFRGMEIASRFFSEEESAALAKLPLGERDEAFFVCWTKKEAYVQKRTDRGLAFRWIASPSNLARANRCCGMKRERDGVATRWRWGPGSTAIGGRGRRRKVEREVLGVVGRW